MTLHLTQNSFSNTKRNDIFQFIEFERKFFVVLKGSKACLY